MPHTSHSVVESTSSFVSVKQELMSEDSNTGEGFLPVKQELMSEDSNTFDSSFYTLQANVIGNILPTTSSVGGQISFSSSAICSQSMKSSSLLDVKKEKKEDGEEYNESSEDDKQSQGSEISDAGETAHSQRKDVEEEEQRREEQERRIEQQR